MFSFNTSVKSSIFSAAAAPVPSIVLFNTLTASFKASCTVGIASVVVVDVAVVEVVVGFVAVVVVVVGVVAAVVAVEVVTVVVVVEVVVV